MPDPEAGKGLASRLQVRSWNAEEFASSRELWQRLLAASDADPLFMSWDWQWRWWGHYAQMLGATLRLVAVYSDRGELVGIAPFFSRSVVVRGLFRTCRLELIGIGWRDPRPAFSDYLDLIGARDFREPVLACIAKWLSDQDFWQELVFCCTKRDGLASQLVRTHLGALLYVREVDELSAWVARLPKRFNEYVASLGSDTRRKLFNHRHKLAEPQIQQAAEGDIPEYLNLLGRYTAERWGNAAAAKHSRAFHLGFAACMAQAGRLRLTRLVTREGPASVMYNVRHGNTVYYLQSGFDPERAHGLSPGYLHFGYAIEAACEEGVEFFDFLAGAGRHREYKQDLLTEHVPVVTYHAARSDFLRTLYSVYEAAKAAGERCRRFLRAL